MRRLTILPGLIFLLLSACKEIPASAQLANISQEPFPEAATSVPLVIPTGQTSLPPTNMPVPTDTPVMPTPTATPFYTGPVSPPCGQILPLLPANHFPDTTDISPNPEALAVIQERLPKTATPAWQRILSAPDTVGLAAYRVGDEANGVYLNADRQMPLASISKLIHLAAYAEAVGSGQLNPTNIVLLEELDAVYLPNLDLGGHNRALADLEEQERIFGEQDRVLLEDVPWMMIRHSSNAAADYLHLLLGQETIEATAVSLGLNQQTAPCPWVGQFLAMANSTRPTANDRLALEAYLADPASYGREVNLLTDAYVNNETFRQESRIWRQQTRRPSVEIQRFFGHNLNTQGSPRDYAALMARFAQNGLSNPESSFIARKLLEWPMIFPNNQELFSNLGYKNGALPGILTTVYYAYPKGESTPIVVALFYRDLPNRTYHQWRRNLPHDELARWLLYDPAAIPALHTALNE